MAYLSLSFIRRAATAVAVAAVAAVAPARADFVLDDMSSPGVPIFYSITSTHPNPYTPPPVVMGNVTRTATITVISGVGPSAATGQYGGGVFEQSTPAASTATSQLNYLFGTAANYTALGATSLTLKFNFADLGVPFSVVLTDGGGNQSTFASVASSGPGSYSASFAAFTGTASLSSVKSIDVFLNRNVVTNTSTTSADFILDEISIQNSPPPPPSVPAPPAALLALAALPVVGARKLLRKKA